jgi:hypothetical protein
LRFEGRRGREDTPVPELNKRAWMESGYSQAV